MSVSDFMTKTVVTVDSQTPIFDAVDLMKQHDIHRLPVVDDGKLVGLITEGTPSKATSLSVYEMNYLLNKTTVADIMLKKVTTIEPDALLEDAISVMRSENVGVLPVMDDDALVGIITNNDIFDAFLKITGYHDGGTRVSIEITDDHVGVLADVTKLLADHQMSILTIVVNRMALKTIVEIQVESRQVAAIEKILSDAGYTVTSAVLTNQK